MESNVESKILILIVIIGLTILIVSLIKKRFDLIVNFGLRIFAGLLAIYILNTILKGFNLDLAVGMNSLTALVVGVLGLPGFALLYGLAIYFFIV